MNPLAPIQGPQSRQFSVNKTDLLKVLRFLFVQLVGLFLTWAPTLAGLKYNWNGHDLTPYVLIIVNALAELARRWLASPPKV